MRGRRRLEAERDDDGMRESVRVLRLLEKHPLPQMHPPGEVQRGMGFGPHCQNKRQKRFK